MTRCSPTPGRCCARSSGSSTPRFSSRARASGTTSWCIDGFLRDGARALASRLKGRGRAMANSGSLHRHLRLIRLLDERRALDVDSVAEELGTTRRSVYRSLNSLDQAGLPVTTARVGKRVRWGLIDGYRARLALSLSWSELVALEALKGVAEALGPTPFGSGLQSALDKMRAAVPKEMRERAGRVAGSIASAIGG